MDSFDILVIILSVTFLIFLIVAIAIGLAAYTLLKRLQIITDKAEEIMDDVETVSDFFRKSAAPIAITGFLSNIVSKVFEITGKKGKK